MGFLYDYNGNRIALDVSGELRSTAKYLQLYSGSVTGQTQGSCIDDSGNIYSCQYSAGKWTIYNIYSGDVTEYTFTGNAYGHMNDLTYCSADGKVYCASMNNTGEVYVFDPSNSMALSTTKYAKDENGNAYAISNLSYNRKSNQFISIHSTNQKIYFYDSNFDYVSHVSITNFYSSGTRQGAETDGTYVYQIVSPVNSTTVIVPYNLDGTRATTDPILIYNASSPEFEAMCYDWVNKRYFMQSWKSNTMKLWWVGFKEYIGDGEFFGALEINLS